MTRFLLEKAPTARMIALAVLAGAIPLAIIRPITSPFNVPKLSLLFAGVAVVGALRVAEFLQGRGAADLKRLAIPALAVAVPLLIAWVATPYKVWALLGDFGRFQGLLPYLAVIALGLLMAEAFVEKPLGLAWGFVTGAALVGFYGVVQVLEADPFSWVIDGRVSTQAISTLGNTNFVGGFLGIALPVAVTLWIRDVDRRRQAGVATVLIVSGWILAETEGGWAAGVAGLAVSLGVLGAQRWPRARLLGALATVGIALVVIGAVVFSMMYPDNEIVPSSVSQRASSWEGALGVFGESPLTGRGPNAFALEGVQHRPLWDALRFDYEFADDPHSVPLAWLANAGVLGLAGYIVLLVWVVRHFLRSGPDRPLHAAFLGGATAYFIQSLVSIDELSLRVALWTMLAGLAVTADPESERVVQKVRRRRAQAYPPLRAKPALALLVIAALGAVWWSASLVRADHLAYEGDAAFDEQAPSEAEHHYEQALAFRDEISYERQLGFKLGQAALANSDNPQGLYFLTAARKAFSYTETYPEVTAIAGYARLLTVSSSISPAGIGDAIEQYERAITLDPLNPQIRAEAADAYVVAERYEDALAVLEPMIDVVGDSSSDFWGALAVVRAHLEQPELAETAIERALAIDSEDGRAEQAKEILAQQGELFVRSTVETN